ncbi:MAG: hypothetical protein GAK34_01161 [Delftia tsuruhatensis]|nr:MAG: hypothetical protein GAK34_01161 [Delftia tsuruhatensis]
MHVEFLEYFECLDCGTRPRSYSVLGPHETGVAQAADAEQGPPRSEGVVPLPRSERGGSDAVAQGVFHCKPMLFLIRLNTAVLSITPENVSAPMP